MNESSASEKLIDLPPENIVQAECFDPKDEDSKIIRLECLQYSISKKIITFLLSALLLFIPLLLVKWYDKIRRKVFYKEVSFAQASHVWVVGSGTSIEIVKLSQMKMIIDQREVEAKTLTYRFLPYYYDASKNKFIPLKYPYTNTHQYILSNLAKGLENSAQRKNNRNLYGICQVEVPVKSKCQILGEQMSNPFYMFQIFSVILWILEIYILYSIVILVMTTVSLVYELRETRSNLLNIQKMAKLTVEINVQKKDKNTGKIIYKKVSSEKLVPGDIIEVPTGTKIPCDAIVLTGSAVVNEAVLTGESVPVLKTPLPDSNEIYDPDESKKYTLYSGTEVIQTKSYIKDQKVTALIIRTGFTTTKGALIRSILYPRASKFSFYADSMKFIAVLALFALIGFCIAINTFLYMGLPGYEIAMRALDLVTITVPPALPTTLGIGTSFALNRLKKANIFCISPPRVNVAGRIELMFFDKTGTLTEEGLNVLGIRPGRLVKNKKPVFNTFQDSCDLFITKHLINRDDDFNKVKYMPSILFHESLAACHSLEIGKNEKGEDMYIGDPLEIEMFKFSKWRFIDIPNEGSEIMLTNVCPIADDLKKYTIGSIKMFDFSSKLQRMSVLVKNKRLNEIRCFCKGSPEKIKELCIPNTLPYNYNKILNYYAQQGCRIIALSTKPMTCTYNEALLMQRDQLECDLLFLGFLIMQNKLKDVTGKIISELGEANIKSIMATGDNIYTAVSVGRECNIVNPRLPVYLGDTDEKGELQWVEMKSQIGDANARNASIGGDMMDNTEDLPYSPEIVASIYSKAEQSNEKQEESDYIDISEKLSKGGEYGIAMTGKAFNILMEKDKKFETQVGKAVIRNGYIFARMTPDGKATLVDTWQTNRKIMIGMCGDGANDCMALRTADMGVSLSQAEASIAAPFTSKVPDISCIPVVLKEGRTALVTSIQCFKFMALYSMIEFMTVTLMYLYTTDISDNQFLFIDLVLIIPIATTMSWSKAYPVLSKEQPTSTLISLNVLMSVIGQILIQLLFQIAVSMMYTVEPWFNSVAYIKVFSHKLFSEEQICIEGTCLFLISTLQYTATSFAFSIGKPYRSPMNKNIGFMINVTIVIALSVYIILYPANWVMWTFSLVPIPMSFRFVILILAVIDMLITYGYEEFLQTVAKWAMVKWNKAKNE